MVIGVAGVHSHGRAFPSLLTLVPAALFEHAHTSVEWDVCSLFAHAPLARVVYMAVHACAQHQCKPHTWMGLLVPR